MIEVRNRLTIRQDWIGKGVVLRFPVDDELIEIQHDILIEIIRFAAPYLESPTWQVDGWYSTANPNHQLRTILSQFKADRN